MTRNVSAAFLQLDGRNKNFRVNKNLRNGLFKKFCVKSLKFFRYHEHRIWKNMPFEKVCQ